MLPIIEARLEQPERKTELYFFNKSETDIVEDDWMPMRYCDARVKVGLVIYGKYF